MRRLANDAEIALPERFGGRLRIHQPAADDDELRIERHRQRSRRGCPARAPGSRRSRAPAGRPSARGRAARTRAPSAARRLRELVIRILRQPLGEQMGQARDRRVDLDASPRPAAAAGIRLGVEQVQRRGHVRGFHARERVAVERQAARVDERAAEARSRRQHEHRARPLPRTRCASADAAHVAVVADDERHGAARPLGQGACHRPCGRRSRRSSRAGSATCPNTP